MNSLIDSMNSLNDAIKKMTAIIPNEVKAKLGNEMQDLNSVLNAVKNEDLDKLTEIKDKYASKNNK